MVKQVRVELETTEVVSYDYKPESTAFELTKSICGDIYGEAYHAYKQFGEIALFEVIQQGVYRRLRSYERIEDVIATWPPHSKSYLKLQQTPETMRCDPSLTRLCGIPAVYTLLSQDWLGCTIDIFDAQFHLRSKEYNGLWRSLDLEEVDVYESHNPDIGF